MITLETVITLTEMQEITVSYDVSTKGVISPSIKVKMVNTPKEKVLEVAEELLAKALLLSKTYTSINNKE